MADTALKEELRQELRKKLRKLRRALSVEQQKEASEQLLQVVQKENIVPNNLHIALYLANDGEINPERLVQWLWQQGIKCYLPVLDPENKSQLLFVNYNSETIMIANRFGINEPVLEGAQIIIPQALDLVFMPLTGFDEQGERLGMGGGFYDCTFEFTRNGDGPTLIGLAHECQKVSDVYPSEWDVPMQGIVTDQSFYSCEIRR